MRKSLFLDFDGTLVDSKKRQYELFMELVGERILSFNEYWEEKHKGLNQGMMLEKHCKYTPDRKKRFKQMWLAAIEEERRLDVDHLITGVFDFLADASTRYSIYVVTARQLRDPLLNQIHKLKIAKYFSAVLNTAGQVSKAALVRKQLEVSPEDMFVGDTGEDILAGKELGVFTVAVTSGVCTKKTLTQYSPDLLIDTISELLPKITS